VIAGIDFRLLHEKGFDMPAIGWGGPRSWGRFLVLAVLVAALGCGRAGTGTISGKVTLNGMPLKGGRVTYHAANNQSRMADIQEDGSYTVANVPVGPARITVETEYLLKQSTRRNYRPPDAQGGPKLADPEEAKRKYVQIPSFYSTPDQSGLTWTVQGGKHEHNIELEVGGPPANQ
jgi:hypothetical protein